MKKIILVVAVLFLPALAFAGWYGDISVGTEMESKSLYSTMEIGVNLEPFKDANLNMRAGVDVIMVADTMLSYVPLNDTYSVGAKLSWRFLYAEIEHWCSHDVWAGNAELFGGEWSKNTRLGVGVHFELK